MITFRQSSGRFGGLWIRLFLCLAVLGFTQAAPSQIRQQERKGLDDALYVGNLTEDDLGFEKKVSDDPYRMRLNAMALDSPLQAANELLSLHTAGRGTLARALAAGCERVFGDKSSEPQNSSQNVAVRARLPEELREPLETLIAAVQDANNAVHQATSKLSTKELRELIEGLPQWAAGSGYVKFGFVKSPPSTAERMLELLSRVDLPAIRQASIRLSDQIDQQLPTWRGLAKTVQLQGATRFLANGLRVEIGGQGDNLFCSRDTNLCINLGGRGHYTGRYGAGVGYASVLIDCGGDSTYDVPDLSIGSGLLGIGLAYQLGGNATYRGGSLTFGAGLGGVGGLYREGDHARFESEALSQGFGMFGVGLLSDSSGNSNFRARLLSQGAGRTQGLGWLIEQGSDNSFHAGGLVPVEGKNAFLSASQGFGGGYPTGTGLISGGVGLLSAFGSGDSYAGEIRCQAAAQWGGIGSVYDSGGHGVRAGVQECQCFANHQAAAFLFDLGGQNEYVTRLGTCDSCANDYSVALLLDREGHSLYASRDGRPACGSSNSTAIFLASGSENTYVGRPAMGVGDRGAGSLGLFCDLGGNSTYQEAALEAPSRVDGGFAVFYQAPSEGSETLESSSREQAFKPGTQPDPGGPAVESLYARARNGGSDGAAAKAQLVAIGEPALKRLLDTHLKIANPESLHLLAQLVDTCGDKGRALLGPKIAGTDPDQARNALQLLCQAPGAGAGDGIVKALDQPGMRRLAAKAAGFCGVSGAVPALMGLAGGPDKIAAKEAMCALNAIGDPNSAGTASALLTSSEWPLRCLAVTLLAKFPVPAIAAANNLMATGDEHKQRTGIDLLACVGNQDALKRIGSLLDTSSPGVTVEALFALQGRFPDDLKPQLSALATNSNPIVRRVAQGIQVDR